MSFFDLLSRADDATLQTLLGMPVLRLLRLLDAGIVAPSRLRALLTELHGEAGLLACPRATPKYSVAFRDSHRI